MANAGIELLHDFSSIIEPKVRLKKDGDKITYETTDSQNIVYVNMTLPNTVIEFQDEEIGFLDFPDFYNNVSLVKDPEIKQVKSEKSQEDYLDIKGKTSKSKYFLADTCVIKRIGADAIPPVNKDYEFTLTKEELAEISKIFAVTKTTNLAISVSAAGVKFNFTGDGALCTEHVSVKKHSEPYTGEEFTVNSSAAVFAKIPKRNYKITIDKNDLIRLDLIPSDEEKDFVVYMVV